jgi:hypothetical protein
MPKVKPCFSCFGRFAGGTLEATNCHSIEWTQVRSRIHKDKEQKKILKLLGSWKVVQDTKWIRNLEVTPKDTFAYLDKTCHMLGHP